MYGVRSGEGSAVQRTYENPHFSMYYPMTQEPFAYDANYSQNMRYSVYPSHLTCDNSIVNNSTTSIDEARTRRENERAIEQFLRETDLETPEQASRKRKPCKIATMRNALVLVAKLNKELEAVWTELKSNVDLPNAQWREKISACDAAKHEICQILRSLEDADFFSEVKKSLEKRRKKRLRERFKRDKWREEKVMREERRAELHAKADSWIRKEQAVIEREKQEEKLRKDADMILSDVRGKRNDARKYLGVLLELQNLRRIKMNIARARGEHLSSAADEAFRNIIDKLTEQWTTLDREYSIEEQGLKLMLKTNNEKRIEKQSRNVFDDWENVLFGRNISATERCYEDLGYFIMTRTAWDKFVSSGDDATTIPVGWIVPEKPSSAAWQRCLAKENP
ncbi:PREDICTED: U11/U12 small nuclear ribonucleoprotein 59 kDa protein-like [Dinoponera quadriceps]|uniref:U11/U12 small nuclear ribonucleoprotein 59 kDa protein-like n=1 Tax=Dinoponera quadriceps TaxID=609295 RepID=A0A6P3X515_DINQU|nr:PREDICTED: U11/U12 small nuclear ribonucleoprotein 59 kDa protein-like [Dinoponera quadriceps]